METGKRIIPGVHLSERQIEAIQTLGKREQNAVKAVLEGITKSIALGEESKPMRAEITPDNPFDFKAFAGVLHGLGIGVVDQANIDEENPSAIIFDPYLYERTRSRMQIVDIDIVIPAEILEFMRMNSGEQKPQESQS